MARKYLILAGIVLLLLSIAGFFVEGFAGILLQGAQLVLYLVTGIIAFSAVFIRRGRIRIVRWLGWIFMLLAVLGVTLPGTLTFMRLDNGVAANILHLLLGIWGLWIGFFGRTFEKEIKKVPLSSSLISPEDKNRETFL